MFEPNDQALWARVRRNIIAFLRQRCGAAARCSARAPSEAFYVKCDEETNPPESVDAGQVICEIGIAPVKPAEFVVFRLAQFSGGGGELEGIASSARPGRPFLAWAGARGPLIAGKADPLLIAGAAPVAVAH